MQTEPTALELEESIMIFLASDNFGLKRTNMQLSEVIRIAENNEEVNQC